MNAVSILCIVGWLGYGFLPGSIEHLSENTRCAGQKHPQKWRVDLEPGEQHTRALLIEEIVGEMVSKQLLFDPDLEIEDKPQGKEGDQTQPAEGNKEQAHSPEQKTGVHGMADIAIRAVGHEKSSALDGRTNIEMTQAHDLDGPTGQQEGGDEQQQGRKMDITPIRSRRQKKQEDELTDDKQRAILLFHSPSTICRHGCHFFFCACSLIFSCHRLGAKVGLLCLSLYFVCVGLIDKMGHLVMFLFSGNDLLGLFLADLQ